MAHVSTIEQGGNTVASTQLSQEFPDVVVVAALTATLPEVLTRGAPRVLVYSRQSAGVLGAIITLEAAISDSDAGAIQWLQMLQFVSPLATPIVQTIPLPAKLCRVTITAPVGNAVTVSVALMAAQ